MKILMISGLTVLLIAPGLFSQDLNGESIIEKEFWIKLKGNCSGRTQNRRLPNQSVQWIAYALARLGNTLTLGVGR